MEEHLAQQTAENVRAGMSPAEARRQAMLKFGAVGTIRENHHAEQNFPFFENLLFDLRYRGHISQEGYSRIYGGDLSGFVTLWSNDTAGAGRLSAAGGWLHGTRIDSDTPLYQMMPLNLRIAFDEQAKHWSAGFGT